MAHKKGQGSVKNGRDSNAQRLGIKVYGGQFVPAGTYILRPASLAAPAGYTLVGSYSQELDGTGPRKDRTIIINVYRRD